jgi:fatty-acyl-CoA synthase
VTEPPGPYRELQERVERLSAALAGGGVVAGDRIGYLGFNHPMFLVTLFAAARIGAIFVPLNFRLTGPELEFVIGDAGVHTLLVGAEHRELIDSTRSALPCKRYLAVDPAAPGWEGAEEAMAAAGTCPAAKVDADSVATIIYTSGTTGHPKGAMLTHGNFWANNSNAHLVFDVVSTDVALNNAPLFHVGGLCVVTLPILAAGGHLVLQRAFDPLDMMQAIEKYRISIGFAVPAMLLFMSQHEAFDKADLSSLRLIAVGGAPMPEPLLKLYNGRGIPVHQGYGMTETTTMISFLNPDRAIDKLGSCGNAAILTEFAIKDPSGKTVLEPSVKGEVCVSGGNVMKGYWNQPQATAAVFDDEGFFHTGDIGYIDEEGFLYLCDRLKDMVISGGENVYPAEVESVLFGHPSIAEVAVIGAPDERWGERVVAVVALKPGESLTLGELQAYGGERLARYKLPRELRLVDALPRNPSGKVLKHRLREATEN